MAYQIKSELCIASECSRCAMVCSAGAIGIKGLRMQIDQEKCTQCGECMPICHNEAIYDTEADPETPVPHELETYDCDAAVVGGGGSGLIAAVRIAQLTGKKVIILEKGRETGGSAYFASHALVYGSKWEREEGAPDYRDQAVRNFLTHVRYGVDRKIVEKGIYASGACFDWMCELDEARVKDFYALKVTPGHFYMTEPPRLSVVNRKGKGGEFVVRFMRDQLERFGVKVLTKHRAVKILTDADGAVTGVLADNPGGQAQVNAKAVVLACGSSTRNDDFIKEYWPYFFGGPDDVPVFRHAYTHDTADVIGLAESAGSYIDYKNVRAHIFGPVHDLFGGIGFMFNLQPQGIKVNLRGERFYNEAVMVESSFFIYDQPKRIAWAIFDSDAVDTVCKNMAAGNYLQIVGEGNDAKDAYKGARMQLDKEAEAGNYGIVKADSLEELAERCGIEYKGLMKTVERFNGFYDKGRDDDFLKQPETLVPVRKPPFYALLGTMGTDGINIGVEVNSDLEVKKKDGGVVPGLYAIGDNSAGWYLGTRGVGDHPDHLMSDLSWAFASGFAVADSVKDYLK